MPRSPRTELYASLSGALALAAFVAFFHGQKLGFAYDLIALPFLYIGIAVLLIDFVLSTRKRKEALAAIAVGAILAFGVASVAASSYGYPLPAYGTSSTLACTTGQYTNSSSPFTTNYASCNEAPTSARFRPANLALDLLYLLPLSGLAAYALPVWNGGASFDAKAARAVFSLTLVVMILIPVFNVFPVPPL